MESPFKKAIAESLSAEDVAAWIAEREGAHSAELNTLAIELATRFQAKRISFEPADLLANVLYEVMLGELTRNPSSYEFPEPAYSVFLAFDAGEFDRGDGRDPIEEYTRPRLADLLAKT